MDLVEIGRVIIAVLGYGLAILALVSLIATIVDAIKASMYGMSPDGMSLPENVVLLKRMVLITLALVLVTMLLLWLTD